jgi:hypothetical protein
VFIEKERTATIKGRSNYDYNGWERTIRNQRSEIDLLIIQIPSLKSRWDDSFFIA